MHSIFYRFISVNSPNTALNAPFTDTLIMYKKAKVNPTSVSNRLSYKPVHINVTLYFINIRTVTVQNSVFAAAAADRPSMWRDVIIMSHCH